MMMVTTMMKKGFGGEDDLKNFYKILSALFSL
jgi:hypothetical protein